MFRGAYEYSVEGASETSCRKQNRHDHGPTMLDRGVTEEASGKGEESAMLLDYGVVVHVAVARQGADGEVVALVVHVAQVVEPVQVDQDRGGGEAQPHQRDQGVSAGDELGLVAVLTEEFYGVVD